MESKRFVSRDATIGDAAVDGLLAGFAAGLAMAAYLVAVHAVAGEGPAAILRRFDPSATASPLTGLLLHLAVAGVYGTLFGLGWRFTGRVRPSKVPAWLWGLAYGLVLLLVAELIPLSGANSPLAEVSLVHFALAHAIYGLVLGYWIGREER